MSTPALRAGLCPSCLHVRDVRGRRGQVYVLCRNEAVPHRYPPQPVVRCAGYVPVVRPPASPEG